ncbi:MAG: non-canonical purine NTP pyrophosphatase, partial [Candidatus Woesearchaeota archaeon]
MILFTGNQNKIEEFRLVLGNEFPFKAVKGEKPELRAEHPSEIVTPAAKALAERLKEAVIVEDSGIFIKALNGFPGTCSHYVFDKIGLKGLLKLLEGKKNRSVKYISAVGYCEPGKRPLCFIGEEDGKIATAPRGKNGFAHDPIFIHSGKNKTYGESREKVVIHLFRRRAIEKL